MDRYKEIFSKGADYYIIQLANIQWFDNPFVNEEELKKELKNCIFEPYLATKLTQLMANVERVSMLMFEELMHSICELIPDSSYSVQEQKDNIVVNFTLLGNEYSTTIVNDGEYLFSGTIYEDGFMDVFINEALSKENIPYRFFELPPSDETAAFILVKPEVYQKALDIGLIPDFMGYFAVNY